MVVLMLLATLWGVAQLAMLGIASRTLRTTTLLLATAVGCYACGVASLILQFAYTRTIAAVTGQSLSSVIDVASYTVDPIIEEVVKILPLVMVAVFARRVAREWGFTDYVLLGGAIGAGFALAEALLRFASRAGSVMADGSGGYIITGSLFPPQIKGILPTLASWLPSPVGGFDLFGADSANVNYHLVWTALAGLGIAIAVRLKGSKRLLGGIPLLYASIDHAANNFAIAVSTDGLLRFFLDAMENLRSVLPALVFVAVVVGIVVDRVSLSALRKTRPDFLLQAERSGENSIVALGRFALLAPPFSSFVVLRFILIRRAAWYSLSGHPDSDSPSAGLVVEIAQLMDASADRERWRTAWRQYQGSRPPLRSRLLNWRVMVWLAIALPPLFYFVLGAVPLTSGIQDLMETDVGIAVVSVFALAGLGYAVWQSVVIARSFPGALRASPGEIVVRVALRAAVALAAILTLIAGVLRWLTSKGDHSMVSNYHILDALGSALIITALVLGIAALFIAFPPAGGALALAGGGSLAAGTTLSATAIAQLAGVLGLSGVLMMAAGSGGGSGGLDRGGRGGSGGTPRGNQAQNKQFRDAVKGGESDIGRKLSKDELQRLHREISHQDYGFNEIRQMVTDMFGS